MAAVLADDFAAWEPEPESPLPDGDGCDCGELAWELACCAIDASVPCRIETQKMDKAATRCKD